jgi:hypothetical protein
MQVWLIETNHMPSLSGSSPLDSHIKMGVVSGALERLNVTPKRKHTLQARLKKKRQWDMMHQVRLLPLPLHEHPRAIFCR